MLLTFSKFLFKPGRIISNVSLRAYSSSTELPNLETIAISIPKPNVYHVELNRPKNLNSFSNELWREIGVCFRSLHNNPDCRVVILSGQGKHFSAGIDLNSMMELGQKLSEVEDIARKAKIVADQLGMCQDSLSAVEECPKPVIGVTHKACIGAGMDLLTAVDIRYCSEDAWFQVKEVDIGMAADVGTLQRLPKIIGSMSVARELCFTARKMDSKEALQLGFVSKVFTDIETALKEALQLAETIALKSPVAIQTTKESMVFSLDRTNKEGLDHIRHINQSMLLSEDLIKGIMAQSSKQSPEYDNY